MINNLKSVLVILCAMVGCNQVELNGIWVIDVQATRQAHQDNPLQNTGIRKGVDPLEQMAKNLTLKFLDSNSLTLSAGKNSVTRSFSVVREEGKTQALGIQTETGPSRRIVVIRKPNALVLVDGTERIVMRRP